MSGGHQPTKLEPLSPEAEDPETAPQVDLLHVLELRLLDTVTVGIIHTDVPHGLGIAVGIWFEIGAAGRYEVQTPWEVKKPDFCSDSSLGHTGLSSSMSGEKLPHWFQRVYEMPRRAAARIAPPTADEWHKMRSRVIGEALLVWEDT